MQHRIYMLAALQEAEKAALTGEVPVGAVIVRNGEIIAKAHNKTESESNPLCHCELIALNEAIKKLSTKRLCDCTLYVTLEPCPMCMGAILHAKLGKVVFGAYDERTGSLGSKINLTDIDYFQKPQTIGGYMEKECSELLTKFFVCLRKNGQY